MKSSKTLSVLIAVTIGLLCAWPIRAEDPKPPDLPKLEVRVLDKGRVVIIRGNRPVAAMQLRKGNSGDPILSGDLKWREAQPVEDTGRSAQLDFRAVDEAGLISLLLVVRPTESGARVLISSTLAEAAPEVLKRFSGKTVHPGELEAAIEIFADPEREKGKALPALSAVDAPGTVTGAPGAGSPLPADTEKPFRATRLSFAAPGRPRAEIARSGPAVWKIKRLKQSLLVTHPLRPDPREPRMPGGFELYAGDGRDGGAPDFSPLLLDKAETPAWDCVEGALRVYGGGADPYGFEELKVFAEIALPTADKDGAPQVARIPCYFREGPAHAPAEGEFRFRFAPPAPGTYGVRVSAVAPGGVSRGEAVAFRAGAPASRGFVRVKEGERVFRQDDGSVFIPVGLNLAWPGRKGDAEIFRRRFRELARHGGNAARVWLSSWGLPLEGPRAGEFDADTAEALDEIFLAAQARDIRLILVTENAHDLVANTKTHPYFRESGGPLLAAAEFFRNVESVKLFKRRLTYLAARYGAYRSLMAWELLNEADEAWPALKRDPDDPRLPALDADTARAARRDVQTWAKLLAEHLQVMDGVRRPVVLSTAMGPGAAWPGLHNLDALGAVQDHAYIPEAADARDDAAFDEAGMVAAWGIASREVGRASKPYFLGEFGYYALHDDELAKATPEARAADRNARDKDGLLLHNSAFAALASGMAATPMTWWWDRYVERHNLWKHFEGPALFAATLERLATLDGPENLRQITNDAEAARGVGVRVLGRAGKRGMCVWVQDRRSTWARLLERRENVPPAIDGLELKLPPLMPGAYTARFLDTWQGEFLGEPVKLQIEQRPDGTLTPVVLKCPLFRRDVAVLVESVP